MIVLILFLVLGLIITIVGMIENESWPFITGLVITFSSLLGMLYGCGQASVTYEIINPSRIERIEKNVYCTFYDSTLKIAASDSAPIFDLEDETGLLNVTCFDDVYLRDGHAIICSPYVTVVGETQIRDGHLAFLASRVFPYKPQVSNENHGNPLPVMSADYLVG